MKTHRQTLSRLLSGAAFLLGTLSASAHIGYGGRNFGAIVPNAAPVTITNQTVTGNYGWADGTDDDHADSHLVRYYRFSLAAPAYVTVSFSGSTNGGTRDGSIKPGFSIYQGLAHLPPFDNGRSADYDTSPITQAYLATLGGVTKKGAFRALHDWRIGGEGQTGPVFDFEHPLTGLTTFAYRGHAADGDASLFGPAPGINGDGNADGTVTKSFFLPAGDFTIAVGGADYAGQGPTPDATVYGLVGTVSASGAYLAGDPAAGGIGYQHQVILGSKQSVSFSGHVGAWSWEDNSLFGNAGQGTEPVGWTHTSHWAAVRLLKDTVLSVTMTRDANVPWPSAEFPNRRADTSSMFPSLTLYRGWDNDGSDLHEYNNRGNIDWAEDIEYVDHVDNSTEETITRTWFLPAGDYTFALGSNAPATNPNRQGYSISFATRTDGAADPVPNTYEPPDFVGTGGIGYSHTIVAGRGESGHFSGLVGAWSWEDNSLFGNAGQGTDPVGWTHTSNWVALRLEKETVFTITLERDATVPDPTIGEPDRLADTSSLFPSFTLYRGWDNDGSDDHTYNNRGNVSWAEDISYLHHVDNSTETSVTRTYVLPAGDYTLAVGSNAPSTNPNSQGYRLSYSTAPSGKVDPVMPAGGIGYTFTVLAGAGETGNFKSHVGAWSWEDNALFAPGQPPVGWTHTSNWLALKLEDEVFFTVKMERDATVPWPSEGEPGRLADISSMFPSLTLYRGWDNTGTDSHTYNNRGNIAWAEGVRYMDHVDNSTQTSITRTWRLPRGEYSIALGSNAPATNANRQGYKLTYSTVAAEAVITGDPVPGGVGYSYVVTVGAGDFGSVANHVGAWSWEDNALFGNPGQGTQPVGWTHTSRWVGVHVKEPVNFTVNMTRNSEVPWPQAPVELNGLADTTSMFPSFTLWRGWHNNGADSHTYNNRGPVAWAPGLSYLDHLDNSSSGTINRTWTLAPGYYTFALGSNAPATNSNRQGFTFSWSASAAEWTETPQITGQPRSLTVIAGKRATFTAKAKGPGLQLQWMRNGVPIAGATGTTLTVNSVTPEHAGDYTLEVRNASGWMQSAPARLTVVSIPQMASPPSFPVGVIGQWYAFSLATEGVTSYSATNLPRGLRLNARTGEITGRPVVSGTFSVSVILGNAAGRGAAQTSDLEIEPMPTGTVGTFTGALGRAPLLNDQLGGCVTITASSLGGYSTQVKLGAVTHRAASFLTIAPGSAQPSAVVSIPRPGRTPVTLAFTIQSTSGVLDGTISDGTTTLPFMARQPVLNPAPFVGSYTFAFKPEFDREGDARVPQGYSFGGFSVNDRGVATGALRLADDTSLTFAGPLETGGNVTVLKLLYKNTGSLLGVLNVRSAAQGDLRLSEMSWFKKAQTAKSKDLLYKGGFGPLELDVVGRLTDLALTPINALGLSPNPVGNTGLVFAHGGVSDPAARLNVAAVEIVSGTTSVARMVSANPGAVQLTVLPPAAYVGGGGAGKAVFKEFTITKKTDKVGASRGQFTLVDVDSTTGTAITNTRQGTLLGTIVDDGSGPKLMGYFIVQQLPIPGTRLDRNAPRLSGSWRSN